MTLSSFIHDKVPISLLCTSYKANKKYLMQLIFSLQQQSSRLFELLVITRTESDTQLWADCLLDKPLNYSIKYNPELEGRTDAFEYGCTLAQTEYLMVLDDDDWLAENAVDACYWVMERQAKFSIFATDHYLVDAWGQTKALLRYDPAYQRLQIIANCFQERHFWGFRKSLVDDFPRLLESPYIAEDYWFFGQLALLKIPVLHIPLACYYYRDNPYGMRRTFDDKFKAQAKSMERMLSAENKKRSIGDFLADSIMAERIRRIAVTLAQDK